MFPVPLRIAFSRSGTLRVSTQTIDLRQTTYVHTNIKRVLPAPLLETSTSVTSRRRHCLSSFIVVSSVQVMCTCLAEQRSPDLIVANRNGSRTTVCGRPPGHHNAVPRCRTHDRAKCIRLCRSSAPITMFFNLYNTIQSGSFSGYSRLQRRQFFSVTSSLPSAMVGSGNFVILVLDVINLPLCTAHTSASPESIHRYIFQSVVLRSPPGEEYTFVELTIESPLSELTY